MAVSNITKALKDIMRMDAGINGDAQYIEQITWMLFLKAFDYKEQEWELADDYYPVIPNEYRSHRVLGEGNSSSLITISVEFWRL